MKMREPQKCQTACYKLLGPVLHPPHLSCSGVGAVEELVPVMPRGEFPRFLLGPAFTFHSGPLGGLCGGRSRAGFKPSVSSV